MMPAEKLLIPFITRTLLAAEKEIPVVAREILGQATEIHPEIRTARIIAKKGVAFWEAIGKSEVLPFEQRAASAIKTVDRFMDEAWLQDLVQNVKANLGDRKKVSLVYTRAYEEQSLNLIPHAMAAKVQNHLAKELSGIEVSIDDKIFQASKANRTSASNPAQLLSRQQIFEGEVRNDRNYILLDDHIEAGSTLKGLTSFINAKGGHVVAIGALTRNPGAEYMRIRPETILAVRNVLEENSGLNRIGGGAEKKDSLDQVLGSLGLKLKTLTNTEGLSLFAHLSHNKQAFEALLKDAGTNIEEFTRYGGGYIAEALALPPSEKTVAALKASIMQDLGENYHYIGKNKQAAR